MRWRRVLTVVDCHAEGEIGRVVTGGVGQVPGETMFDKRVHLETEMDDIRKLILPDLCEVRVLGDQRSTSPRRRPANVLRDCSPHP